MTVRLTADQAKLIFGAKRPAGDNKPAKVARIRKPKEQLPENIVTKQIVDFLQLKGWRPYRQQVGAYMPYGAAMVAFEQGRSPAGLLVRIGTPGLPDWRFERPTAHEFAAAQVIYVEMKAPGKRPDPDQLDWMRKANATGTVAVWFDSFSRFEHWYREHFPGEVRS